MNAAGLLFVSCCLVHLLFVGFLMAFVGYSRAKVAGNVLMILFAVLWLDALLYWAVGWAFSEGSTAGGILGIDGFFLQPGDEMSLVVRWWLHALMNSIGGCIAVSGLLGRTRFAPTLIAVGCLVGAIFPMAQHWIWNAGGWLAALGFHDFAGATALHLSGGTAALAATFVLRPRRGRFTREGLPLAQPAHNLPLSATGVGLMTLGFLGLSLGRIAEVSLPIRSVVLREGNLEAIIGHPVVCSYVASAAGAFAAMLFAWGRYGKPDITLTMNGAIAGLVAVAGVVDAISPVYAVIIGGIGGTLAVASTAWLDKWQLDDIGGVIPVHAFCGAWGTLATGIFHSGEGLLLGNGFRLLGVQALGLVSVVLAVGGVSWGMYALLHRFGGLRVPPDAEHDGLDHSEHANEAYPEFQTAEFK